MNDVAQTLSNPTVRAARRAMLAAPHIAPLTAEVERLRAAHP
jgi:hypothetical protein